MSYGLREQMDTTNIMHYEQMGVESFRLVIFNMALSYDVKEIYPDLSGKITIDGNMPEDFSLHKIKEFIEEYEI